MEHAFSKDRDFKALLCLWAPPCPINLTQFLYTNSGLAWTPHHLIHYGKSCLTITPLEWLVAMNIFFDKNTGGKTFKTKWIFASNLISSILKALQDLSFMRFTSEPQLQKQLDYTKCLVSDVVSNAQNRAVKNWRCIPILDTALAML